MIKLENKYLSFDITSSEVVEENPDSRFITVRMQVFASGENLHGYYCSEDVLRQTAPSIYNTPIIYNIDTKSGDFGTHTSPDDSLICGFVIPNSETFERLDDGRLALFVLARISKMYCPDVVDILQNRDGNVKVSVEMILDETEELDSGEKEMLSFTYYSTCLLGSVYREASPLAHLEVLSFAENNKKIKEEYEQEFSDKYYDIDFTIPDSVKRSAQKSLDYYKNNGGNANSAHLAMARYLVKNEKMSSEKMRNMYSFFKRRVEYDDITRGFYGGKEGARWSSEIMSQIDEVDNKIMSYFGEFLTFPYSKISDAPENMKKLDGVPLSLTQINKIAEIADSIGVSKEKNGYAIAKSQFKKTHHVDNGKWVENKKEKEEALSVENEKGLEEQKEEKMSEEKLPESEQKPEEKMAETEEEEKKEDPKEEKGETSEEENKEESKEEKMSLDGNLDMAALMAMLADETEDYKSLVAKHEAGEEMDYAMLCSKMFCKMQTMAEDAKKAEKDKDTYMSENAKLKEYKAGIEKKQFDSAVEFTLKEVSDSLPKEEIEKARESSKEFSLDNISAWENNVRSLAFSYIKDAPKKKESFTRIATINSWLPNSSENEDRNQKYAKEGWL